MTSSSSHPDTPQIVIDGVTARSALGVIALGAAIAGAVLASAIAGGVAIEAPAPSETPGVVISSPENPISQPITTNGETERRGGLAFPLHAN